MLLNPNGFRNGWLFGVGLALRLVLVCFVVPLTAAQWFTPFIVNFLAHPSFDPWSAYIAGGGTPLAFPYGPVMLAALLPGVAIGAATETFLGLPNGAIIGYGFSILAAELACLALLARIKKGDVVLACIWLSPAMLIVSYWHGQNDLVPTALMLLSLVALRQYRPVLSGAALGLSIAAKLSMVLTAPLLLIYLFRNTRLRRLFIPFSISLLIPILVQCLIFTYSPGARLMVLGTPEAQKVFELALNVGNTYKIYILPVSYLLVLFWVWRLRRITFDLLLEMAGIVFLLVILLTPASPGWFIWASPFLAIHAAITGSRGILLVLGLSALEAVSTLMQASGAFVPVFALDLTSPVGGILGTGYSHAVSILFSTIVAVGLFLAYRMWREGIRHDQLYRMSQRPLLFGIAGDSGSGKDSLALAIAGLFGEQAVASVSGDDYHNWDRGRPMWSVVTHLNPRANNLQRMADDVLMLASGLTMNARHYDHKTGRFTKPRRISFNDVIIVSGLHTLLVPSLRRNFDVSIFLGMDEELRRYFKIRRDIGDRGHSPAHVVAAIERRVADADLFISPQREYADVIFSLNPVDRVQLADPLKHREVRLKLVVLLRKNLSCEALVRALIGLCGLRVDATFLKGSELVELVVDGDVDSEDIAFAAGILIPDIEELISLEPKWEGGMTGIMQLISLAQAAYAIRSVDLG